MNQNGVEYTLILLETALDTGSFTVLNTKLEDVLLSNMLYIYIHQSSFTVSNVTVHIKSAINVHTIVANINVTVHINQH